MHLSDLLDLDALERHIAEKYVKRQTHPTLPLVIYNYTDACQYDRVWNEITRTCRGLIVHRESGEVVARPWAKFFNHGQEEAGELDLTAPVEVTDKMDGSLGILYHHGREVALATRGSFASEQAVHATALYKARYCCEWKPDPRLTYLFEIVYPGNRIVCDYGDRDDLVLLGAVVTEDGRALGPGQIPEWPGPRTETFQYRTLADALAAPPRPGAEGLVVRDLRAYCSLTKIKQEDYVALHRLVFGMNERVVWERLGAGETAASLCDGLPDEFHGWVTAVAQRLTSERDAILAASRAELTALTAEGLGAHDRKAFAERAKESPNRAWLFMLLDGKDPSEKLWRTLRPSGAVTMTYRSEDVA